MTMTRLLVAFVVLSAFAACNTPEPDAGGHAAAEDTTAAWKSLFDGESISGWHTVGDEGRFYAEDGLLVGEVTQGGGYLATDQSYDDFIMEADVRVDSAINSGFQIRSRVLNEDTTMSFLASDNGGLEREERTWEAGRVTGYQIEVDPTDRAWSGGLYEPSGRGWLQPLMDDEEAQAAFNTGEWNTYRIKAHGDTIQTWVNEVPVVNTTDSVNTTGFIALQAHSAHSEEEVGKKIYWRNLRLRPLN